MTEIICISCWSSFQVDPETAAGEQVTCPLCDYVQAGPTTKQGASTRPKAGPPPDPGPVESEVHAIAPPVPPPVTAAVDDPFEGLSFDSVPDMAPPHDDSEVSAVSAILADIAQDGSLDLGLSMGDLIKPAGPNTRPPKWRLRTASGLLLEFPTYETAIIFAAGHDGPLGITCGKEPFRRYRAFHLATKEHADPLEALRATPSLDERPSIGTGAEPASAAPQTADDAVHALAMDMDGDLPLPTESEAPAAAPQPRSRTLSQRKRPSTMSEDFTFRTGDIASLWPTRAIFLTLGMVVGGVVVYYLAWLGVMPGILY